MVLAPSGGTAEELLREAGGMGQRLAWGWLRLGTSPALCDTCVGRRLLARPTPASHPRTCARTWMRMRHAHAHTHIDVRAH